MQTKTSRPPIALTALGQPLVNALYEEIRTGVGKYSKLDRPPTALHALDQPLVTELWNQLKYLN